MANNRSPNYPQLTLPEALERLRKVYKKEHTHVTPKQVVAEHLGYSSLNGASLTMIGSIRRYGLLESQGDGLRVSNDAVTLLELPTSDPRYKEAFLKVIFAPSLFKELRETLGVTLPSEANLRHTLILKGFLSKAANEVIRVYGENLKLVDSLGVGYSEADSPDVQKESAVPQAIEDQPISREAVSPVGVIANKTYPMDISIARNVFAELKIRGELTREDVAKLRRQIERQIDAIADGFDEPDEEN